MTCLTGQRTPSISVLADVLKGLSVESGSDQLRTQLEGLSVEIEAHAHQYRNGV
jgi:hypothetical protein